MAESYALVAFENPAKAYPVDVEVKCSFVIKHPYQPSSYDWVGLFRVPWSSVKDKFSYQYISLTSTWTEDADKPGSVVFQSANLPGEDGEYYQFVYFDGKGHMRGASSPFTFRQPHAYDLVEEVMSEDSDMLFITTRQTQLETQITELQVENDRLQLKYNALEEKNRDLLGRAEELEETLKEERVNTTQANDRLKDIQVELQRTSAERESVAHQFEELEAERNTLKRQLELVKTEKEEVLREMSELRNNVDELMGEVSGLRREKELYVHHVSESDTSRQKLQEKALELQQKLDHHKYTQDDIETLEVQVATAKEELDRKEKTILAQQDAMGALTSRVDAAVERHKLDVMEKETVRETLENLSTKYEEVSHINDNLKHQHNKALAELDTLCAEKRDWESTLNQSKEANKLLSDNLQQASEQVEQKKMDDQRYVALTESYSLVKEEFAVVKRKLDARTTQEKQVRASERMAQQKVQELQQKVQELQQKLKEGEKEWRKVSKKNAELERKLTRSAAKPAAAFPAISFRRPASSASDELTREELQKLVADMGQELEEVKAQKDKYKEKYKAEKQRIATIKDDFKTEREALQLQLANERSASTAAARMGTSDESAGARLMAYPPVQPIVYPPVIPRLPSNQSSTFPLLDVIDIARFDQAAGVARGGASGDGDSDDENIAERFHDAVDVAPLALNETPPESCCMCHSKFDSSYDEQRKTEHVNTHLVSLNPDAVDSTLHYRCPMCPQLFDRAEVSEQEFLSHVQEHFPDDNGN